MQKGRNCSSCGYQIERDKLGLSLSICPNCGYYMGMHAEKRILSLADKSTFREWDVSLKHSNPLNDSVYEEKILSTSKKYNLSEAIIIGEMNIEGIHVAIGVMDARFMMASMGRVVGEKVTVLFEKAKKKKLPVMLFCCSGGARMQEGIFSLMQMEKTAAAVKKHSDAGLLYISVLANPTMGGVTASFAMIADIILAEKDATIGFAGSRVIEQNIGVKIPEDYQKAEFQKKHGFIDEVIEREWTRNYLHHLLKLHYPHGKRYLGRVKTMHNKYKKEDIRTTPWERVKIARGKDRPTSLDYINKLFEGYVELYGDRVYGDDHAIVAGLAYFKGIPVTVIGQQKGKGNLSEAVYRNWGMLSPHGYRKALRMMKQAEKFHRPIICFVDTVGAACGMDAEKHGQGTAIADLLREMSSLKTPIVSIIISEGGSGGALAMAVGNEVWILENAVYSILTPEGYASILWKDNLRAPEAADKMKLVAEDLFLFGIVEKIIPENEPVTINNMINVCIELERELTDFMNKYTRMSNKKIVSERYKKFRKY